MRAHTSLPLPSSVSQIDGLQALRAAAVILVAWLHTTGYLHLYGAPELPNLGVFGIDIFFVISGFILSSVVMRERERHGAQTMWRFLRRRLVRIYPVYWVFASVAIFRLWHSGQLFAQSYVSAFFLLPPLQYPEIPFLNTFAWTLIFEMTFYFLLAVILLQTVKLAPYVLILVLCASVGVGCVLDIRRPVWIIVCNPILLEFVFGAVVALVYRRIGKQRSLGITLSFVGVVAAFFWAHSSVLEIANGMQMIVTNVGVFARVVTFGVAAFLMVGGVVLWSPDMRSAPGRMLVVLGNASYSTYLISSIAIEIELRLLPAARTPHSAAMAVLCALTCVTMILVAGWVFYNFVEWPLLRFLKRKLAL